jgi:hypothetical protein
VVRALASECKNMIGLNYVRGTKVLLDSDRHARSLPFHVCLALVIARLLLFHIRVALFCCCMQRQTMAVMKDGTFMRLFFWRHNVWPSVGLGWPIMTRPYVPTGPQIFSCTTITGTRTLGSTQAET